MISRTFAKQKNKNSASFSSAFAKKPSDRSFTTESTNADHDVTNSHSGHNFGNIQVKSSQSFNDSCPLAMSYPSRCPYGGACHTCAPTIQTKLKIGQPNDKYEQEADKVADQVMRMPEPQVQRKGCLSCNDMDEEEQIQTKPIAGRITPLVQRQVSDEKEEEEELLQTKEVSGQTPGVTQDVQMNINNLRGTGKPLPESERSFFEQRFGYDFSQVRVHSGAQAVQLTRAVNARAFTVGRDVVLGTGQYAPEMSIGRRLIAHELTHVVQQGAAEGTRYSSMTDYTANVVQRQIGPQGQNPLDDPRMHPKGAPKATSCSPPSHCPKHFCQPYESESYAKHMRTKMMLILMGGIALAVDSRVVPLWHDHLLGGSSSKSLTKKFGKDFEKSKTTKETTAFLVKALKKSLQATPPTFPPKTSRVTVDIGSRIGPDIKKIDDPSSSDRMNFDIPKEVPGNLAGDIGKDQLTCKAGAKPSPFNDERTAKGTVEVKRAGGSNLTVVPSITYTVKDTIDLCPGDCGTKLEQIATVPISQFEATGISGDVPFTVEFPAPATSFTIPAKVKSTPKVPSSPPKKGP